MPADLGHSVFGRFHDGGAGDHVGAAVIHFRRQAEAGRGGSNADFRGGRLAGMAYHCSYGLNGELFVAANGKLNDECAEAAVPLPDIGEYATRCTGPDHEEIIAVGKRTHGQTRIAQFYVPLTRGDVYLSIAKLLGDRL